MRGRRGPLLAGLLVVLTFGGAYLAANPVALERLTTTDQGGNGRSDLWTVSSRIGTDRPVAGVGLNNFHDYARDYTRDVGTLRFVRIIAERPHVVHNTYLQLWAETGVIGLGLFLALAGLVLRTLRGAARRFAAARDRDGLILADAVFVSVLAGLAASFFLSNGPDWRMWFMWGLAPALGLLAARSLRHA
jgi:O-antigen ligase